MKEKKFKYFRYSEFRCPCCGKLIISDRLIMMLDQAREIAGIKFIIASGYRCPRHNFLIGGKEDSSHLKGFAADIFCVNLDTRYKMLKALIQAGFNRIGIYPKHIHVDIDPAKPPGLVWLGEY